MTEPASIKRDWIAPGMELLIEGGKSGKLYVLKEGEVEIIRGGIFIASISQPGAIFGEMSVLLDLPHSATVRAVTEAEFFVVENAIEVLQSHPDWLLQIARLVARRLNNTTAQLAAQRRAENEPGGETGEETLVLPQYLMSQWGDPAV